MKSLIISSITKLIFGLLCVGVLVFLPAGTLAFPNGWLFMGLLFIPMLAAGIIMLFKAPSLLEKRLDLKEKEKEQKSVVALSGLMFVAGFILAGLEFRFGWSGVPRWAVAVASAVFISAYILYAEVLRENAYLSRTIKVQDGQKVISTGLYGVVRHPMYMATIFLFLSMPIVLGSLRAFIVFLAYPVIIAIRILNEEKVLEEGLEGYSEYKKKVRYRLLPFIW